MIPSTSVPLKIQHLTIGGPSIEWNELQLIFRSSPHLRYLNVRLMKKRVSVSQREILTKVDYVSILQTLILHFEENDPTTFEMFTKFFRSTPNLRRLEVNAHDALIKASAWEQMIESALPSLTHFYSENESRSFKEAYL